MCNYGITSGSRDLHCCSSCCLACSMAQPPSLPFVYISGAEVRQLVSMSDVIDEMSRGLQWFSAGPEGGVVQPVRSVVPVDKYSGYFGVMPAFSGNSDSLGAKLVTFYPKPVEGVPSHQAIVVVLDPHTGTLQAIVDGVCITNMRTAAASACAIRALLACGPPPSVVCIVGTGVQARSHAEAVRVHHNFTEVRVWGRTPASTQRCAADVGGKPYESLPDALRGADVVVTVTMATEPVVLGRWLKPGAVVCAVGSCRPDWRELDDDVMQNSVVTVDSREAAMKESGDIILSGVDIFAEIGEIISGAKTLPRVPDCGKKFLLFKSLGLAIEDVLSGKLIYDRYIQRQTHKN